MPELTLWWPDFASFVQMGKHGPYVWGSAAAVAVALVLEQWALTRRARRLHERESATSSLRSGGRP